MLVDFNTMEAVEMPCLWNGGGVMSSKMFIDDKGNKFIKAAIRPGGAFGKHNHSGSMDIVYVLEGEGIAVCDGAEERLVPGVCHVCPDGSEHQFKNTGDSDLVILTFVPKIA